jgi:hypothetical protein
MPLNFREGMRRLGILVGVLGAIAGAIGGYLLAIDARVSAAGLVGEPVLVDYAVAASLPVVGFLISWGAIRVPVWIWAGFSAEPTARGRGQAAGGKSALEVTVSR